jgi:hypothetical protein
MFKGVRVILCSRINGLQKVMHLLAHTHKPRLHAPTRGPEMQMKRALKTSTERGLKQSKC